MQDIWDIKIDGGASNTLIRLLRLLVWPLEVMELTDDNVRENLKQKFGIVNFLARETYSTSEESSGYL